MLKPSQFSKLLLDWFDQHGRHDLPWQKNINPYRVWISEIMLQQTQVTTVVPYFERFTDRFPTVNDLANAAIDEVLHLWSGLGYYARGRNLHKAAVQIVEQFDGEFPSSVELLQTLPGIGRSTAGAIFSIAMNGTAAILDGNVKRVLTRYLAVAGWPGKAEVAQQLWNIADTFTPKKRTADYTQAIMDLGATICTRTKPTCLSCPFQKTCLAFAQGDQTAYPDKKPRKALPIRQTILLIITAPDGRVLLQKRPATGIWGGLWSLPECTEISDINMQVYQLIQHHPQSTAPYPTFRHTFSHYHLEITPVQVFLDKTPLIALEPEQQIWYNTAEPSQVGLPKPTLQILQQLEDIK